MSNTGSVEDRLAIRELLEAYADAVCCVDADAWGATWAEDSVWELPDRQGKYRCHVERRDDPISRNSICRDAGFHQSFRRPSYRAVIHLGNVRPEWSDQTRSRPL
jgi:hypothetical protein